MKYKARMLGKAVPKWCVDAGDNEDIVETIRDYVKTHFPLSITNCDINARVCYAMLLGGMTNGVVSRSSCAENKQKKYLATIVFCRPRRRANTTHVVQKRRQGTLTFRRQPHHMPFTVLPPIQQGWILATLCECGFV